MVFDLATIRYRFTPTKHAVSALASSGELLAQVDLSPHHDEKEAAFLAADAALRGARVKRASTLYKVALYNPYSAVICVGPVPHTLVYGDRLPLEIPTTGLVVDVLPDYIEISPTRCLSLRESSLSQVTRDVASHALV